ncbi:MAG TPA: hypothetical protein VN706_00565 [Gemmatimonadaceae bacterium]|nr:hypothetical protein [Gemmatimonadaceae bacterium]
MHLVSCATPQEPLEAAPRTALLADLTEGERWEGFWSSDDAYFVRCTKESGDVNWYRLADDEAARPKAKPATRVLAFPTSGRMQTRVVVAQSPSGRRMLVGNAGRSGGSPPRRTAE